MKTLTNDFHKTSVRVKGYDLAMSQNDIWMDIAQRANDGEKAAQKQMARISRALCGMKDCTCGTVR